MADSAPIQSLHLLSEMKFLPWIKHTFSREGWCSEYIIINRKLRHQHRQIEPHLCEVSGDEYGIRYILRSASGADFLFHHFLDNIKAEIIVRMQQPVIHCWCFYGAEIYQQTPLFRDRLYGKATVQKLKFFPEIRFRYELRALYYRFVKRERTPLQSLQLALPRIDYILWYIRTEINFIQQTIQLPPFLFFQYFQLDDVLPPHETWVYKTHKKILIGNSATIENNHFDVLAALRKVQLNDYEITLPLTYGQFSRYKKAVKREFTEVLGTKVTFVEKHIPLEKYYDELKKHRTAIFLHHRQQGLGNIFYLLYIGAKVYLSNQSIIYTWLRENDIQVFSFEDEFITDFNNQDIGLTDEQALKNRELLRRVLDNASNEIAFDQWEKRIRDNRKISSDTA